MQHQVEFNEQADFVIAHGLTKVEQVTDLRKIVTEAAQHSNVVHGHFNTKYVVEQVHDTQGKSRQQSKAKDWSVVRPSPSKRVSSGSTNLEIAAENLSCSISFGALVNAHEHGEKDQRKSWELVDGKVGTKARENSSSGSAKQQQQFENVGVRSVASKDIVHVDDFNNV